MSESDKELVNQAIAGNRLAFGKLIAGHQKNILYLAYDLTGNYEDAKDVAQNAFVKAFENLNQFRSQASFSSWLYRITVNAAYDFLRQRKRHPHVRLIIESTEERIDENTRSDFENIKQEDLTKALDVLSEKQRSAVVLKYFHGKSAREIGEILNCSEATARVHIYRGLENLRDALKVILAE